MRKSKLNKDRQKRICDAIRRGLHLDTAARLAGIDPSTFWRWMKYGEEGRSQTYRNFYKAVKEAEAEAEERLVGHIESAALKCWQAAAWILERRHPERWARTDRLIAQHTHAGTVEVVVKFEESD